MNSRLVDHYSVVPGTSVTTRSVTPMIYVPDIRAAVEWYESIGFDVVDTAEEDTDGWSGPPFRSERER